jgi:hypothetical protein
MVNPWRRVFPYLVTAFGLALAATCCREVPDRSSQSEVKQATATPRPEDDSWARSRECAEQADRMIKRNGLNEGQRSNSQLVTEWSNHYSPKFHRCFVLVSFLNEDTKSNRELPLITRSLFDAFENREIASYTDSRTSLAPGACSILENGAKSLFNCAAAERFIMERMSK